MNNAAVRKAALNIKKTLTTKYQRDAFERIVEKALQPPPRMVDPVATAKAIAAESDNLQELNHMT